MMRRPLDSADRLTSAPVTQVDGTGRQRSCRAGLTDSEVEEASRPHANMAQDTHSSGALPLGVRQPESFEDAYRRGSAGWRRRRSLR